MNTDTLGGDSRKRWNRITEHLARCLFLLVAVFTLASCGRGGSDAQGDGPKGASAPGLTSTAEDAYIFGLGPVAMYKWYQAFAIDQGNLNRLVIAMFLNMVRILLLDHGVME